MLAFLLVIVTHFLAALSANKPQTIHGGSFLALAGKNCVVLATDSKYISPSYPGFVIGKHTRNIYRLGRKTLLGIDGWEAGSKELLESLRNELSESSEEDVEPSNIAQCISYLLLTSRNTRGLCSPLVAGIESSGAPFICSMDGLGAMTKSTAFAAMGTACSGLLSLCESLYTPELEARDLIQLAEQCMQQAFQRDILSGNSVKLATLVDDSVFTKEIEFKNT